MRDFLIYLNSTKILKQISTYIGEPFPRGRFSNVETYDYRIDDRPIYSFVPPTLVDTFICDIWQRINRDLGYPIGNDISYSSVYKEIIDDAINIYCTKDWSEIAGYRPWTHWNFIRSLTSNEREILSSEILEYILRFGIREMKIER